MDKTIELKGVVAEDFIQYKIPSMFLITCYCDWKCCYEFNLTITTCQNQSISQQPGKRFSCELIYQTYISNPITASVVIGGLEPMIQLNEILDLVKTFRVHNELCPFVIYTGYYPEEISESIKKLEQFKNIIIKFGRYVPNQKPHYDEVLGINLASDNQYGEVIS